jgi:hypothetical protein
MRPHIMKIVAPAKEIIMHAHGHTTVWGTHLDAGRASASRDWYQQLKEWWAARTAMRREARLAALAARWDAAHEAVRPLPAEAAMDIALRQATLSVAIEPIALAI